MSAAKKLKIATADLQQQSISLFLKPEIKVPETAAVGEKRKQPADESPLQLASWWTESRVKNIRERLLNKTTQQGDHRVNAKATTLSLDGKMNSLHHWAYLLQEKITTLPLNSRGRSICVKNSCGVKGCIMHVKAFDVPTGKLTILPTTDDNHTDDEEGRRKARRLLRNASYQASARGKEWLTQYRKNGGRNKVKARYDRSANGKATGRRTRRRLGEARHELLLRFAAPEEKCKICTKRDAWQIDHIDSKLKGRGIASAPHAAHP